MQATALDRSSDNRAVLPLERFTTGVVNPSDRLAYWNELANDTFTGLAIDSLSAGPFDASLERMALSDVGVAIANASASSITHERAHIARATGEPHYLLHLQLSGSSVNEQAGRRVQLAPGEMAICDTTRPYRLRFTEEARFLVLRIAVGRLRRRLPGIDDAVALRVVMPPSRSRILRSIIAAMRRSVDELPDFDSRNDAADVLVDLAVMCLRETCAKQGARPFVANARRFFALADTHFADPDFGVSDIACELGVSTRCVQKAFATHGTTTSEYILRHRLHAAARALTSGDDTVTDIAFASGFNDLSYFTRAFRRRFGETPRQFRQRGLLQG